VFIGDERTEDSFTAPAPDRERLYYGFSIMSCLPSGMVGPKPAGTGTVMRADTVGTATEAGFTRFGVLPIANDSWRFTARRITRTTPAAAGFSPIARVAIRKVSTTPRPFS
jgi:hypothetical protein